MKITIITAFATLVPALAAVVVSGAEAAQAPRKLGGKGAIGPRWTWDPSFPKPNGTKNMGSYSISVYTPEQQKELG